MATIRELRYRFAITQEELAAKAKLSVFTVSRIEQGKHRPEAKTLRAIAKALKTRPENIDIVLREKK